MQTYKVTATPLLGDSILELLPVSLSVTRSLTSPAVSMRGRFAISRWPLELVSLKVTLGSQTVMEGKIDIQRTAYSKDGMTLELEARSKGAALLDNEAMPRSYQNLYTSTLFDSLIAPFDFLLVQPQAKPPLAEFTIRKDQSLWEAFCAYTRRVHGLNPYVVGDMVVVDVPRASAPLILGDETRPFSSLEQVVNHYSPLSRVVLRGEDGAYVAAVNNTAAQEREIQRVRYLIPANEFAAVPVLDANQRIQRSMSRMQQVVVTVPGYLGAPAGQPVWIRHPLASLPNLLVEESVFTLDERGAQTRLTLTSSLYYS